MKHNVLSQILLGCEEIDSDILLADKWIDESISQIESGEEPTLTNWIMADNNAIIAFKATMAAVYQTYAIELEKGTALDDATRQTEALIYRLAAAYAHKATLLSRASSSPIKVR